VPRLRSLAERLGTVLLRKEFLRKENAHDHGSHVRLQYSCCAMIYLLLTVTAGKRRQTSQGHRSVLTTLLEGRRLVGG